MALELIVIVVVAIVVGYIITQLAKDEDVALDKKWLTNSENYLLYTRTLEVA
jgi:hypothetical protein